MFAVASSSTTILLFFKMALQMQMIDFTPELKFPPFSVMWKSSNVSSFYSDEDFLFKMESRPLVFRRFSIWESEQISRGSKLYLKEPLKRVGSWGIIVMFFRSYLKLTIEISTPSTKILPESSSRILNITKLRVLLPAPVLPTTPILWPPSILRFRPFKTSSVFSLYLTLTELI